MATSGDMHLTPNRPTILRRAAHLDDRSIDLAIAVAAAGFALVSAIAAADRVDGPAIVIAAVAGLSLAVRRRFPLPVLAVAMAGRLALVAMIDAELALTPAVVVALFTVARVGRRPRDLVIALVPVVVMAVAATRSSDEPFLVELVAELAQGLAPLAVGDAVRTRADRLRDLIEAEAEARVRTERLRIARDLHDVVAHGLSAIAVQSGVAARLVDHDPAEARRALESINATGRASLDELRAMVGVLRSDDDPELRPLPTDPDDIAELIAGAERAGVVVSLTTSGAFPVGVGDAVVVALHRILREALTNAGRHGRGGRADVSIAHRGDRVEVEVVNELAGPAVYPSGPRTSPSSLPTGMGLIGMRERAESLGGSLQAGPDGTGRFRVSAELPYRAIGASW